MSFVTRSPWTGKLLNTYKYITSEHAHTYTNTLTHNHALWRKLPLSERTARISALTRTLSAESERLAELISAEMGKPVTQARSEIVKSIDLIDWYIANTQTNTKIQNPAGFRCHVQHEPLGVIFGLMPWNYPLWQVMRWAVPALLVGNTCLLKPAEQTAGTGEFIAEIFTQSLGLEVLKTAHIQPSLVHELIYSQSVRGVSFTGSTKVGRLIAASAGGALKKCVTELGGSDPLVVLSDADDVEEIARVAVRARMVNTGQSCISPKRIIVHTKFFDGFKTAAIHAFKSVRFNDDYGPVVDLKAKTQLDDQLRRGVEAGAKVLAKLPEMPELACHFAPCLVEVEAGNPLLEEEIFGPIMVLVKAGSDEEAVAMANDSPYGLGCSVFTRNATDLDIQTGMCFFNSTVRSDARLPFGGTKDSGIGRECGEFGLTEFTNLKLVCYKI